MPMPPLPLPSERLSLRQLKAGDIEELVELASSSDVRRHLGGPADPAAVRREIETVVAAGVLGRPEQVGVADATTDELLGMLVLEHRDPDRPGHVTDARDELELSYVFRPSAWGHGFAEESIRTLLAACAQALPDQPIVLVTQSANTPSLKLAQRLGFQHVDTFVEFGAEQWFGTVPLDHFRV